MIRLTAQQLKILQLLYDRELEYGEGIMESNETRYGELDGTPIRPTLHWKPTRTLEQAGLVRRQVVGSITDILVWITDAGRERLGAR